jgi:glycosyltransferase involved in cell wall biosynthesis
MARLVFITGSLVHGGAERHSITLTNRLGERGHECHAVYVKNDPSQLERLRVNGQGTIRCLEAASYLDRRALADLTARLKSLAPDKILASNPYALMYATLARQLSGVRAPIAVTFHSNRLLNAKEHVQMLYYRGCFWLADLAVFVCENQRRYWKSRGVLGRRNAVIHNGIDLEAFHGRWNGEARSTMRSALGYSEGDFVVALSAVLRPEKNPVALVDAVALLRQRGLKANALFIGDGPMRPAVEARARELGIDAAVTVAGAQLDVRPHLAASDALALCSHTEAFSLAAIEAMGLHKPVVHSEVGGAAEMIRPGWNGFLYPAGDTAALAQRLGQLARRPSRMAMGNNARRLAELRFSEARMVDRYEELVVRSNHAGVEAAKTAPSMLAP